MAALRDIPQLGSALTVPQPEMVEVLAADPELGNAIDPAVLPLAVRCSTARAFTFGRGPWSPDMPSDAGTLGGLVLSGLILVRIEIADRCHAELLGEGDVVSPGISFAPDLEFPAEITSRVISPIDLALLDRSFAIRMGRWPEVQAALIRRLILRTRRLSLQSAINAIPRTQQRLELTLWQLSYRFGRVTPAGLRLRLPVSHAQLAEIVATQRPSVSIALSRMQQAGRLVRTGPGDWLLRGPPPADLGPLVRRCGLEG